MKKSHLILAIVGIIVVVILFIALIKSPTQTVVEAPTGTPSSAENNVHYSCSSGTIDAVFNSSDDSVKIMLPDGRTVTLPHVVSADGAKYETGQGTNSNIVFWTKGDTAFLTENDKNTYTNCVTGTSTTTTSGTTSFTQSSKLFTFDHPSEFTVSGGDGTYTQSWMDNATTSGMVLAQVTIPKSYQAGTNFSDAKFTVGVSSDPAAIKSCLTETNEDRYVKPTQVTINGVNYSKFVSDNAGAGNLYQTTSYRTVRDNQCYAIEYTIHSTNIGNYEPGAVKEFDKVKVQGALEQIVKSFKFL